MHAAAATLGASTLGYITNKPLTPTHQLKSFAKKALHQISIRSHIRSQRLYIGWIYLLYIIGCFSFRRKVAVFSPNGRNIHGPPSERIRHTLMHSSTKEFHRKWKLAGGICRLEGFFSHGNNSVSHRIFLLTILLEVLLLMFKRFSNIFMI